MSNNGNIRVKQLFQEKKSHFSIFVKITLIFRFINPAFTSGICLNNKVNARGG